MMKDYINKIEQSLTGSVVLDEIGIIISAFGNHISIVLFKNNFEDLYNVIKYLINKNYIISSIEYSYDYKDDKSLLELDYTFLHKSMNAIKRNNSQATTEIYYDDFCKCDYEEFVSMIECIKWYRNIINEYMLSPIEKLTYAYDICKTIHYRQSGEKPEDISNDNKIHLYVKTGNIVCLGYNRLLKNILSGIDGIRFSDFSVDCYDYNNEFVSRHSRGIVRIDDDKYGIHGIYVLDVTWDSVHEDYEEACGEEYDCFSSYRFFLVPIYRYGKYFRRNTYPRIFTSKNNYGKEKFLTKKKLDSLSKSQKLKKKMINKDHIDSDILPLLDENMSMHELYQCLNCDRPDIHTLLDIIYTVRFFMGYDFENIEGNLVFGIDKEEKNAAFILKN